MSVEWHGSAIKKKVNKGIVNGLEVACFMIDAGAKRLCPVDTGNLRSSIGHEVDKTNLVGEVSAGKYLAVSGSAIKYAIWVEVGARNRDGSMRPAKPYMRPAYEEVKPQINSIINKQIAKALK